MSSNPETTLTEIEKAMQWERMSGERLPDAQRQHVQNGGKFLPPGSSAQEECWVISVCLDGVDGVAADAWMDAIEAAASPIS